MLFITSLRNQFVFRFLSIFIGKSARLVNRGKNLAESGLLCRMVKEESDKLSRLKGELQALYMNVQSVLMALLQNNLKSHHSATRLLS